MSARAKPWRVPPLPHGKAAGIEKGGKIMQVFVFVLNRTEHLENLLQSFADHGLRGATVLDSKGMARILHTEDEMPIFYGLRAILEPERRSSKTIFMVLKDEQVDIARQVVNEVTGGLDVPDSGIMFALPLTMVEGLEKKK
jgi:predicted transcriptional regulator